MSPIESKLVELRKESGSNSVFLSRIKHAEKVESNFLIKCMLQGVISGLQGTEFMPDWIYQSATPVRDGFIYRAVVLADCDAMRFIRERCDMDDAAIISWAKSHKAIIHPDVKRSLDSEGLKGGRRL